VVDNDPDRRETSDQGWAPHLWAIVIPFAGIFVAYVLWFGFMALFRLPDWLARLLR
jgi:hypothetical protein